jgi:septum site-determining protein MinC
MISHKIKLNSANFEYYILRISPEIELAKIQSKLMTLREFDANGKYLVLELDSSFESKVFSTHLTAISALVAKFAMEIKFILANQFTTMSQLNNIPVIDLPATIQSKPIYNQTLVVEEPVRSGIKIENDGDIVVTTLVSHNAEIIATGNIHIYGDCRGKVIAGNFGNRTAKIFIARFNAELISIGGIFRVIEEQLPASIHNKAVQIFLDDKERLNIIPLAI